MSAPIPSPCQAIATTAQSGASLSTVYRLPSTVHLSSTLSALRSWFGVSLAFIYLAGAGYLTWYELRHSGGGWINLRGFGTTIATAPSQATVGVLLRKLGAPRINHLEPGFTGIAELLLHLVLTASVVYLVGFGLEWIVRWVLARF
jgi:hypothetical protein